MTSLFGGKKKSSSSSNQKIVMPAAATPDTPAVQDLSAEKARRASLASNLLAPADPGKAVVKKKTLGA